MIKYIKGIYSMTTTNSIIVENSSGIGFEIFVPLGSGLYKNQIGDQIKVMTYMIVKEDDISLYGFEDKENLELFKQLISVNGVGPKAAMSIMSLGIMEVKRAIVYEDSKSISSANGIGKKTAERIILELKDKVSSEGIEGPIQTESALSINNNDERNEAINALMALGYSKNEAFSAVGSVADEGLSCEEYIKKALKNLF